MKVQERLRPSSRSKRLVVGVVFSVMSLLSACAQISPVAVPKVSGEAGIAQAIADNPNLRAVAGTAVAQNPALQATATAVAQAQGGARAVAVATAVPVVPTPTPGLAASIGQMVALRRGPIEDSVALIGRVAGQSEVPVSFQARGVVASVAVKPGQTVQQGDLLMETDSKQAIKDVENARLDVESSRARLRQAQASHQSRRDAAVADAEDRLRRAQDEADKVRAGASASERRSSEAAVNAAQAAHDKAKIELERSRFEPTAAEAQATAIRIAEQKANAAQISLRRAQADLAKVMAGPDPLTVRAAERALADAQVSLQLAQVGLDRLIKPDAADIKRAERDVERARIAVSLAESSPTGGGSAAAQITLDEATERLAAIKSPPKPEVLAVQKNRVAAAEFQVSTAQEKLDLAKAGPLQIDRDAANAAVAVAQSEADAANAALQRAKQAPIGADPTSLAQASFDAADLALQTAIERNAELLSHPTEAEQRDSQSRVALAQTAVERALEDSNGAADLAALQKAQEKDETTLARAEAGLESSRLVAPQAGVVAYVQAQPGDTVDSASPSVILAVGGDAIVLVPLPDGTSNARVAAGQVANIQMEGGVGTQLTGQVVGIVDTPGSRGARAAQVQVAWNGANPAFGTSTRVGIVVQKKDNVLIAPARAVRSAGTRRFVETIVNGERRTVTVQVGIVGTTDAEILDGLTDADQVLVPPPGVA